VNGDGQLTATDALTVLRAAVGQSSNLVCAGDGPSQLRYYNDFSCQSGSSVSQATVNGLSFEADAGAFSDYQTTDLTTIDTVEIDLCGTIYDFTGPVYLPPDRSMTFWMVLLDPAVYQSADAAQLVITDDGTAASAGLAAGQAEMTPARATTVLYGHRR